MKRRLQAATAVVAGLLLSSSTGCGAISALTNPKAAWVLQEPSPMSLILRRADVARATSINVDRLLSLTPVDVTSRWIPKLAVKKDATEAALKDIGGDADYAVPKGQKLRVLAAEMWAKSFSELCPHESKLPSVLAQVSPDLGTSYAEIASQGRAVAKLKADKALEETALDAKDLSDSDRETHEKKKRDIEDAIDKAEREYRPKVDAFLTKARELAGKASPEAKKQVPVALTVLHRAIEDAKLANSVALVRFPMALPGMTQELKTQAKRIVADILEEKTGHRPNLDKFDPDIKLEGGSPKITLNGLPPEAMASLKPAVLLGEITTRSKDYVVKVLTLPAFIAQTQEQLELETEVIKALMEGMTIDEAKVEGTGDDLADLKVEMDDAAAAAAAKKTGKGARHPVPQSACGKKLEDLRAPPDDKAKPVAAPAKS